MSNGVLRTSTASEKPSWKAARDEQSAIAQALLSRPSAHRGLRDLTPFTSVDA
jgi:hypothetical protein